MIGSRRTIGNFPRAFAGMREAATLILCSLLLTGCADMFYATVGAVGGTRGVDEHRDISFDDGHRLALDVYAPQAASEAPVVVFFYGGSWTAGKRHWYRYVGDALARHGVVAVIPDYRKYPEARFPDFVIDAAHAVAWAHAHAREFGGDARRLFVMGHSAGGQIAALLACDPRYLAGTGLRPRDLAGMIGLAGAYAFLPFVEHEPQIFGDDERGRHDSQPINFVDAGSPPLLLLQGTADDVVPPRNAQAMAARAGSNATLKLYSGVGHSTILLAFARGRYAGVPVLADTLAFIARVPASAGTP